MGVCLIADLSWWADPGNWWSITKAAGGLGLVIFVHELGHFLVAKACGVKCEKFYIGFDVPMSIGPLKLPSAFFRKKWGETEYGIGIIPLGGYVKMLGQDDNPANAAREAERIRLAREQSDGADDAADVPATYELDPRSYPAKSVPQRMAIISAGVIMNLIFAVIFAASAYLMGVSYVPCNIGRGAPGDPAWQVGMQPGDKIIQLGREGTPNEQLNFSRDLRFCVASTGHGNDLELLVRRSDETEHWITVQPNSPLKDKIGIPTIGVLSASSNEVRVASLRDELSTLGTSNKPEPSPPDPQAVAAGDIITSIFVDGREFPIADKDGPAIQGILARYPDQELTLVVTRDQSDGSEDPLPAKRKVSVSPRPMRHLGFALGMDKIVAVRVGSPAERAGIQSGDVVIAVNGDEVFDPLRLDAMLRPLAGQQTTLTLRRAGSKDADETEEVVVIPEQPTTSGRATRSGGPAAAETIGIAFSTGNKINHVAESGPAVAADVRVGDVIELIEYVPVKPAEGKPRNLAKLGLPKSFDLVETESYWPFFFDLLQDLPEDVSIQLTIARDGKREKILLSPEESSNWFHTQREFVLDGRHDIRTAAGFSEAVSLGFQETWTGTRQVFFTLKHIKEYFRHLGGPGTIAVVATSEASQGIPRLLTFLTLLSANLAVLNFLPIPVLDGGHMVFLMAEGIRGKPVDERWAFALTILGLSFILGLMVLVIGMDVYRFSGLAG